MNSKNTFLPHIPFKYWLLGWCLLGIFSLSAQRYTFKKIGLEQGIPSSRVNDFIQDSRGFFWLATEGAGLVRYDGFEFKTIDMGEANLNPLVTALAEDDTGNIWLAGTNVLMRYNGLNFKFYYLPEANDRIGKIAIKPSGEVVVSGQNAAYQLSGSDTLKTIYRNLPARVNDLAWHHDQLWLATDSGLYAGGAKKMDGSWLALASQKQLLYASGTGGLFKFKKGSQELMSQLGGEWLYAGRNGLLRLSQNRLVIMDSFQELMVGGPNGLPKENFEGCYLDRSGVVWLFSNNGLTKLENTSIRLYGREEGINTKVYSVLIDGNGTSYAGAANGLSLIDKGKVRNFFEKEFPFGVVLSLAEYDGKIWIGTERGLVRYDGTVFTEVRLHGSSGEYIFALKGTQDGLWVGTSSGIFRIKNGDVENVSGRENLPVANIFSIAEGRDGSLWFGTYTQGFIRRFDNKFEIIKRLGDVSFDSLRFNTFAAISKNEIWAGTLSEGIFHISDTGFGNIPPSQLNFAEVRSMAVDESNRLWLGTNKGLTSIIHSKGAYYVKHLSGVKPFLEEGCSAQALEIKGEKLVAGTAEGLLTLALDRLDGKKPVPQIAITDVELFYGDVTGIADYADGFLPFSNVPHNLKLPHNLNFLSFTLAGLSGYNPEGIIYRYRIKGQNSWTLAGSRREAVYFNLKPGSYSFEAQASRDGENWGRATVTFPFEIQSPIWQRWWFITFIALLLGALTYWFISDRLKRINQRLRLENGLLEMERKALRLQMNPHFIFNALDSISSFIFKNDPKQAVRYLNNFAKLMRLTLESSMEHLHPVETEVSILKNYLELEKLRFQGKFDYEIEIDQEIDYDVGIPPMLIQPHVENAILHGIKPKKEKGHVHIRFILQENLLICEVEDDGIGRRKSKELPKRQDHRSMATKINRDRLRLLKLSVSDQIDIEIIDKQNPTGTKVIIKLPAENI